MNSDAADADRQAEPDVGVVHQHQGEEEVRHGEAEVAEEGRRVVAHRVLPHRRVDTDGKGQGIGEEGRRQGQQDGEPKTVADHVDDRQFELEGIAEVTL